ncbi:MAG: molecular chaperone [Lutibacter sp.]|uniref:molecular chaperone n=1 Tax=Lutibacter sp. TaxID=1925666 RepID=UPI0019E24522|nr:molecular chaperone [Lutibacter sp.]NOR28556.1 molecular chaperone [Lutibacter sp.]
MNSKVKDPSIHTSFFRYILLFVFLTTFVIPLFAQGDLLIYPRRVVFDGKKKIEKLVLSNTGKDTAVYNISFLEYKMNTNGELKIISESEEGLNFASSNVRFFPRKVTLAPNEAQTVKVQIRNTQNLTDGEYRSHLYFRAEEDKEPLGQTNKKRDSTISVQLKAIFGIAIPCIVRKGTNTTTVTISDLKLLQLNNRYDVLQFNLNRNGNMSAYGDFTINYITTNNVVYEVAKMKGVGVYTPGNLRILKIKLNKPATINFEGGEFKVIFTKNESKKVLAEAVLKL